MTASQNLSHYLPMPSDDYERERIAAEVRAELARQNKTLRELAGLLGMTHQSVHNRVSGRQSFRAEELVRFAAALGVPVTNFLPSEVTA